MTLILPAAAGGTPPLGMAVRRGRGRPGRALSLASGAVVGEPSFDALGLSFSVACEDPGLGARLDEVLGPFASAGPAGTGTTSDRPWRRSGAPLRGAVR